MSIWGFLNPVSYLHLCGTEPKPRSEGGKYLLYFKRRFLLVAAFNLITTSIYKIDQIIDCTLQSCEIHVRYNLQSASGASLSRCDRNGNIDMSLTVWGRQIQEQEQVRSRQLIETSTVPLMEYSPRRKDPVSCRTQPSRGTVKQELSAAVEQPRSLAQLKTNIHSTHFSTYLTMICTARHC